MSLYENKLNEINERNRIMNLYIKKMPNSACKLIPVASELIPEGKLKTITFENKVFEIVNRFTFQKNDFIPKGFLKIVFGKDFDVQRIWKKYTKSTALIVYVCFPLTEEKKQPEQKEMASDVKVPSMFSK